ncbi:MAG: DUF29 domain-containing protein [Candidatus Competibacteraceae bacterium]|nr:DUF29 domain-containing protein [Candidatus Competibacteraceae bacterium]
MNANDLYERDFYAWAQQQAEFLKNQQWTALDVNHLIEEIEDMGSAKITQIENRLGVLLAHLLKWQRYPEGRCNSWAATIMEQREKLHRLIRKNPSVKPLLAEAFTDAYRDARLMAFRDTGLPPEQWPVSCPFSWEQALDDDFWP